ncbi:MAG: PLD nuclease N-terminal domain-containing protein [Bacteroidetes bacterium]|nr:PLD nuclease N-terminal domain-containing protein [Bacteroidota bacterium]
MRRLAASASLVIAAAVTTSGCLMVGGPHHRMGHFGGFFGRGFGKLLILALQIMAVVEILRRSDLPREKQAIWALVVLLLPVIGLIAYAIWGRGHRCCTRPSASDAQA